MEFPQTLNNKLEGRIQKGLLRTISSKQIAIDFSSNDYLGLSKSKKIFEQSHQLLIDNNFIRNGATGSRLLSGNFSLYEETEKLIAAFHQSETALIYNSGYDANLGFFSAVPQKGDVVLYDELIHASIRDGIRLSVADSYKFKHNDCQDLEKKIKRHATRTSGVLYVVTESVFSMDGDSPDLETLVVLCEQNNVYLVVDEAHTLAVFGKNGEGLLQSLDLHQRVFARIVTFGKGLGCHGAAVLGSVNLQTYLVNFSRSFIYTTGLNPHSVATVYIAYRYLKSTDFSTNIHELKHVITHFNQEVMRLKLDSFFIKSDSAIHCCVLPGNTFVKEVATAVQTAGFDVKPILSPTVTEGQERLRFCLHSYNSKSEVTEVLELLCKFVK